jgi:HK97 family phage major capsid protein
MYDSSTALREGVERLEGRAADLVERIESSDSAVRDELRDVKAAVQPLGELLRQQREWNPNSPHGGDGGSIADYYPGGSFYRDVAAARAGDSKAVERLEENGSKAMTEGTASAGGYMVTNQVASELIELRVQAGVLRQLIPSVAISSDTVEFVQQTGGLTAGWVAELATKPQQDMTLASFSVSAFTMAGLAVVSNQLLADAGAQRHGVSMGVDTLINRDLAKRLATLEEIALIDGSGTGQPLGILGTGGVNAITYTDASPTAQELLDAIYDAIVEVQVQALTEPTAIVMHPRTWKFISKARESTSPSTYIIGAGATAAGRRGSDPLPIRELFGVPVVLTSNMPTNKGAGSNESRIIVGDFREAVILDRQGVTVDTSEHVYFTSNQTVFRGEARVGFTAARVPKAFSVIQGTGLAGN